MRLWHRELLAHLPKQILQGQHRECCALRGKGWYKNHSTVQYALDDEIEKLIAYHEIVMNICEGRGVNISREWYDYNYRGKKLGYDKNINQSVVADYYFNDVVMDIPIYEYHNDKYLLDCLNNLWGKMTTDVKRYNNEDYSLKYRREICEMFKENYIWFIGIKIEEVS